MELITMGSFMFCPRLDRAVISNNCMLCDCFHKQDDEQFCIYDDLPNDEIRIVDLITTLLELLEKGQMRIGLEELTDLFPEQNDKE